MPTHRDSERRNPQHDRAYEYGAGDSLNPLRPDSPHVACSTGGSSCTCNSGLPRDALRPHRPRGPNGSGRPLCSLRTNRADKTSASGRARVAGGTGVALRTSRPTRAYLDPLVDPEELAPNIWRINVADSQQHALPHLDRWVRKRGDHRERLEIRHQEICTYSQPVERRNVQSKT